MSIALLKQQIARLQAQISAAGIDGDSISVTNSRFGAGSGGDDVAKINAAIAYAVANNISRVHFPAGTYVLDCQNTADATTLQALIAVPSNMMITGDGPGRTIISIINATEGAAGYGVNCFGVTSKSNVIFDGLHFVGENDPYAYVLNNQGCCIRTYTSDNVIIRNCRFESLWHFSCHDDASTRVHLLDCSFEDCANGPNINADYSLQSRLSFKQSEGIEASGAVCVFSDISGEDFQGVALSLGGNQGAETPGSIAVNISIDGSTGNGVVIADGWVNGSLCNVVIRHCSLSGLVVLQDVQSVRNITFNNVTVDSNCVHPNLGTIVGAAISGDGGHSFFNCRFTDQGDTGYRQIQAFSLNAPDCTVDACVFQGHTATITNKDASFGALCTGLRLGGSNRFENATQEFLSGCTIDANNFLGIADTDRVFEFQVWNDSPGAGRRRFALQRNGKMTWGNGLDLEDTNLYRNAADQLKTDDKLLAALGIGVGNSAAASSAVGTLVKKIEVFDASGNSLGFVPVYSSIT
jgi:hypothetical protein